MGLDAVELVMGWEAAFGIEISNHEAAQIRTPRMAIDFIAKRLGALEAGSYCLGARAFNRLRTAVIDSGIPRSTICLDARISQLFPGREGKARWTTVGKKMGVAKFPPTFHGLMWLPGSRNIRDVTNWLLTYHPRLLMSSDEPWSRRQVRSIVRTVISNTMGVSKFSDDDDFIKDLRMD